MDNQCVKTGAVAIATIWCTRMALSLRPSWSPALTHLSGLAQADCFSVFVSVYKAFDPHINECKLRQELTVLKPNNFLDVPIDINRSGSHLCGNSTACGDSEESNLPLLEPDKATDSSLITTEINEQGKEPNLFRKPEKLPIILIKSNS